MKRLLVMLFMFVFAASAHANVDGTLSVKVFGMYASTDELCTNLEQVFFDPSANYTSMEGAVTLGEGVIADGTYPCVAIVMSDTIQFVPEADDGAHCTQGETYTLDVCRDHGGGAPFENPTGVAALHPSVNADSGECDENENIVTMWLTTAREGVVNDRNIFAAPEANSTENAGALGSAFVVSGASAAQFVVGGDDLIDGSGTHAAECEHGQPAFTFTQLNE